MAPLKKTEVKFCGGFHPKTEVTAEQVMDSLGQIRDKRGGTYTPDDVVAELANKKHLLHDELTWEDSQAAHKHRLAEAARLMRAVYVIEIDNKPVAPRRIDLRVKESDNAGKHVHTDERTVLKSPDFSAQVAARAYDELVRWTERHQWLVDGGLLPKDLMSKVVKALRDHPRP